MATASPAVAPHAANATARSRPWKVVDRIASVAGSISDAPQPSITASPITSTGTEPASEASSEPPAKMAAPTMNVRRGP